MLSCAEKQRDAPDSRKGDDGVDYSAENGILTAADPGDDVKSEKPDASPVQRTDYSKRSGRENDHAD